MRNWRSPDACATSPLTDSTRSTSDSASPRLAPDASVSGVVIRAWVTASKVVFVDRLSISS